MSEKLPQTAIFPPAVAVFNHKGGVAKTTTSGNLAACLAAFGYRVLLVDLDAQGNATGSFGIQPLPPVGSFDVITGRVPLDQVMLPTPFPGLSLLPATTLLRTAETELAAHERSRFALRNALAEQRIGDHADIVVIDCPPSLGAITGNALAAAAAILIPARADPYSHEGLVNTWHEIHRLRQDGANASLHVAGILMTMTGEDRAGDDVARSMRAEFGDHVYGVSIQSDAKVTEAAQLGVPVAVLDPDGGAGGDYVLAAAELIARLRRHARRDVTPLSEPTSVPDAQNTLRDWRARLPALQRVADRSDAWTAVEPANPSTMDADDFDAPASPYAPTAASTKPPAPSGQGGRAVWGAFILGVAVGAGLMFALT